jgi:hypothetical protein
MEKEKPKEIKPCPFCGGIGETTAGHPDIFFVRCLSCNATGSQAISAVVAERSWNIRYQSAPQRRTPQLDEAVAWLSKQLSGDPIDSREIESRAAAAGIAVRTLDRARVALRVISVRIGFGCDGRHVLALPSGTDD